MHLCKYEEEQRRQVDVKQKYNQDTDGLRQLELESVGDKMPKWEPKADKHLWALSDPRLINHSQDEKEVLLWSEELGVNM